MLVNGIHHVTAFARSPRENIDFYTRLLGLRMVKVTVNYDDPETYHLYYADCLGTPGTVMTFFPHPDAEPGRHGSGQVAATGFAIPSDAMDFWLSRLAAAGVEFETFDRFGQPCIAFTDTDGLRLELVGTAEAEPDAQPWETEDVAANRAILGFSSVTLSVRDAQPSISFLRDFFGFRVEHSADNLTRLRSQHGGIGSIVDVQESPDVRRGSFGPGTVHHVAWRAAREDEQSQLRTALINAGFNVTEVKDRQYFRSIYFREPGGVVFEVATDGPGFTVDEPEDALGSGLRLPPWLEADRERIEAKLPSLDADADRAG